MWRQSVVLLVVLAGLAEPVYQSQGGVQTLSAQELPAGTHQAVIEAHQEKVQLAANARAEADAAAEQAKLAESQALEKKRFADQKEVESKENSEKAAAAVKAAADKEASEKAAVAAEARQAADAETAGKLLDIQRAATQATGNAEQKESSAKLEQKKAEDRLEYIEKEVSGKNAASDARNADAVAEDEAQRAQKETAAKSATMAATEKKQQEERDKAEKTEKEASRKMDEKIQMMEDKEAKINREYLSMDERERALQALKITADKKLELAHRSQKRVSKYAAETEVMMKAKHLEIAREVALFENQTEYVNRTLGAKERAVQESELKVERESAQNRKFKSELHQMAAEVLVSAKGLKENQAHLNEEKKHISTMANRLEVETLKEKAQKKEEGYRLQTKEKELQQRELKIAATEERATKVAQKAKDSLKSAHQKKQEIKNAGTIAKQLVADLNREDEEQNGPQLASKSEEEEDGDEHVETLMNTTDTAPSSGTSSREMSPTKKAEIIANSTKPIASNNTYVSEKTKVKIQRQKEALGNATALVKSLVADLNKEDEQTSSNATTNVTRLLVEVDLYRDA